MRVGSPGGAHARAVASDYAALDESDIWSLKKEGVDLISLLQGGE